MVYKYVKGLKIHAPGPATVLKLSNRKTSARKSRAASRCRCMVSADGHRLPGPARQVATPQMGLQRAEIWTRCLAGCLSMS